MTEEDYEIEYLDEDEDLVQQCAQVNKLTSTKKLANDRSSKRKRNNAKGSDGPEESKKKKPQSKSGKANTVSKQEVEVNRKGSAIVYPAAKNKLTYTPLKNDILTQRKMLKVRIPDYEDPLCLPVNSIKLIENDQKRLRNWNLMCLDQFSLSDKMFRPDTAEESVSSTRTLVFKNVLSKTTGRTETSIWSKTTCEGKSGERKSAVFQCSLPRYKGKSSTRNYSMLPSKLSHNSPHTDEVIITKEMANDEELMVVYKPKDFVSAVYMFEEDESETSKDNLKRVKEMAVCKMCVLCYQTSWRGYKKNENKTITCVICSRSQVSVYSLLAHLKTHSAQDVKCHKKQISRLLASIVDYHYKCRICQKTFDSIKTLRKHVFLHRGINMFHCEVGSHHTT